MRKVILVAASFFALGYSAEAQPITLNCSIFTATLHGCVPQSGGGTTKYLRADGTFQVPPGSSGPCVLADNIGFVGDNSTDNVAAWNAWAVGFTAAFSGYCIQFGQGWYRFSTGVSIPIPVSAVGNQALVIRGIGSEGSNLYFVNGGGIQVNPLPSFEAKQLHVSGLSLWTSGTTGTALNINNGVIASTLQSTISDVVVRGVGAGKKWGTAIRTISQGQLYIRDFIVTGADTCIDIANSPGQPGSANVVIESGSIGCFQRGVNVGNFTQSVFIDKVIFNGGRQVHVEGPNTYQVTITNSVFSGIIPGIGQPNDDGVFVNSGGAIQIMNNLMYCNQGFSCIKANNARGVVIIGNVFRGWGGLNSNTGVTFGVASTADIEPSTVVGNSFSTLATGVNLLTGSTRINVQSNAYAGNSTNTVNSGTGNTIGGGSP